MPLYVMPKIETRGVEILTLAGKAGIVVLEPARLFEMYPEAVSGSMVFVTLDDAQMALLHRNMAQLLPEVPTAVMSAPGVVYTAQWMMLASPLPVVDYLEISGKIAKSGLLAHKPEDVAKRGPFGSSREVGHTDDAVVSYRSADVKDEDDVDVGDAM